MVKRMPQITSVRGAYFLAARTLDLASRRAQDTSQGAARTSLLSGELGDDLPGEALDHLGLVGDARHVNDEVVDPRLDLRTQPLDYLLRRADHELVRVLVVADLAASEDRGFHGVVSLFEQEDVYGGGACDLLVVAPQVLAVPAQHAELVPQPLGVAVDVAGV